MIDQYALHTHKCSADHHLELPGSYLAMPQLILENNCTYVSIVVYSGKVIQTAEGTGAT